MNLPSKKKLKRLTNDQLRMLCALGHKEACKEVLKRSKRL